MDQQKINKRFQQLHAFVIGSILMVVGVWMLSRATGKVDYLLGILAFGGSIYAFLQIKKR